MKSKPDVHEIEASNSRPRITTRPGYRAPLVSHVLAPTDLSAESWKAVNYAMWLARRYRAKLTLLHICQSPRAYESPDLDQLQSQTNGAEGRLERFYDVIRAQHPNTAALFRYGDPKTDIPAVAGTFAADLIVISTHNYPRLLRFVEGSQAAEIVRHAHCPVLMIQ